MTESTTAKAPAELQNALNKWKAAVGEELKGASFEKKLVSKTFEGIALQPLYTRLDLEKRGIQEGLPGVSPYTRGFSEEARPTWEFAQQLTATSLGDFARKARRATGAGQTSLVLRLSRECRWSEDSDDHAEGHVHDDGLCIKTLGDLSTALDGLSLGELPLHVDCGATPLAFGALLMAHVRSAKMDLGRLSGSVCGDPLGEWLDSGELPLELNALLDDAATWTNWAAQYAPHLSTVGVDIRLWNDAGADAVQELAFALSCGVEYMRALQARGVEPATLAARLRFSFGVGPQFFTEVAKQRAFRQCWARILYSLGLDPSRDLPKVHAQTTAWNFSRLDPNVNQLRVTTEALSAVLGGIDSLHVGAIDDPVGGLTEQSERMARNVHILLAEEFGLAFPQDPAGGSFYIESLTDDLSREAWKLFQQIEAEGGYAEAIKLGLLQARVTRAAAEKREAVCTRRVGLVGVNLYPNLKDELPKARADGRASTANLRSARLPAPLADLNVDHKSWMEVAIEAAARGASIGQLMRFAHARRGRSSRIVRVASERPAGCFEHLRDDVARYRAATGSAPKVFLAKLGPPEQHKARADFSSGFFTVGGFQLIGKSAFTAVGSAATAAVQEGAQIVVLCSTDENYAETAVPFAKALKESAPWILLVLAGNPGEREGEFRNAGFDDFIHLKSNVYAVLKRLLLEISGKGQTK